MKITGIKNFYETQINPPYKQIKYTGYAALAATAGCLIKTKQRSLHKTFGVLSGVFGLAHLGLIKYCRSRSVNAAQKNKK